MRKIVLFLVLWLATGWIFSAQAKTFVAEAARVVNEVKQGSVSANQAIKAFYQDFNRYASQMVDLETRVERWKKEGYLCDKYEECPEKWDAIYAQYQYYMRGLEEVFNKHREKIQEAVAQLHRQIYQALDKLQDLKSEEMMVSAEKLKALNLRNEKLKVRRQELLSKCPPQKNMSMECRLAWRQYNREVRRLNYELKRALYLVRMAKIQKKIIQQLNNILQNLNMVEENTVLALSRYAELFENFEFMAGSEGMMQIANSVENLKDLVQKVKELNEFAEGVELKVMDFGKITEKRLAMMEGVVGDFTSRSEEISAYTEKVNEKLLQQLKKEIGSQEIQ